MVSIKERIKIMGGASTKSSTFQFRLTQDLLDRLEAKAQELGASKAAIVTAAIEDALRKL